MKTKLVRIALLSAVVALSLTACKKPGCTNPLAENYDPKAEKDDGSCLPIPDSDHIIDGNITENTTWTSDKVYILTTRVAVTNNATLTIEPGTIIKGEAGTGPNATSLIIARGSKIMAQGTPGQPIIFTSVADEIQPGQIASPNLSTDIDGLWGGLLILGNAPISADAPSAQIEGIPVSDANGRYGGDDEADNSGILQYVSIRHGGSNIGATNEINGLTLGGVGSGTTIDHVEIVANLDDGIEWFGGAVNVSDVVVWNAGDDAIDTDQGWSGTLDNFIVIHSSNSSLELDGPEGAEYLMGHTIQNGSIAVGNAADTVVLVDNNSYFNLKDIYLFDFDSDSDAPAFNKLPVDYPYEVTGIEATLVDGDAITSYFLNGTDAYVTLVTEGANSVGADKTAFATWTWADIEGALSGF